METLFIALLFVGFGYAVITFLLGGLIGDGGFGSFGLFFFKPTVLSVLLAVFGGTGLFLLRYMEMPTLTAFPIAALAGTSFAYMFHRFLIVPLQNAQNTTAIEIQSLIGHMARVTEKIPQGKYGKITYKVNDSTYSAPAKSEDGSEIDRNTSVEIMYIDKNTYYVRSINEKV